MYHPGKVLRVFSPGDSNVLSSDSGTQALVSMWDENLTTVLVHKNLSDKVNTNDIVLVDYRPLSTTLPMPRLVVTKILKGDQATETWRIYKERQRVLKSKPLPMLSGSAASVQPSHSYIG
jgi:hypothetical protein